MGSEGLFWMSELATLINCSYSIRSRAELRSSIASLCCPAMPEKALMSCFDMAGRYVSLGKFCPNLSYPPPTWVTCGHQGKLPEVQSYATPTRVTFFACGNFSTTRWRISPPASSWTPERRKILNILVWLIMSAKHSQDVYSCTIRKYSIWAVYIGVLLTWPGAKYNLRNS